VFNAPRFLNNRVEHIYCPPNGDEPLEADEYEDTSFTIYFRWPGDTHVKINPQFERVYNWLYFTFGICIPCAVLITTSTFLVRALRRARCKLRLIRAVEVAFLNLLLLQCKNDPYFYGNSTIDWHGRQVRQSWNGIFLQLISNVCETDILNVCDTIIKKTHFPEQYSPFTALQVVVCYKICQR